MFRRDGPRGQRQDGCHDGKAVIPPEGSRQAPRIFPNQPVAREGRNNATADQHDQRDSGSQPQAPAGIGDSIKLRLDVKEAVSEEKDGDRHENLEIAPVPAGDDLAGDRKAEGGEKGAIDDGGKLPAERNRQTDGEASRPPQQNEHKKPQALHGQPARPVGHRRQEKAGDDRREIAEQHLMDMPVHRQKQHAHVERTHAKRHPYENRKARIERAQEEKRPEAVGKQGGALEGPEPGNGHECTPMERRPGSTGSCLSRPYRHIAMKTVAAPCLTSRRRPARTTRQRPCRPCRDASPFPPGRH